MPSLPYSFMRLINSKQIDELIMHPEWELYRIESFLYACGHSDDEIVRFFIEKQGCDPAYKVDWPLYAACENGQFEIAQYLLSFENVRKNANAKKNRCLFSAQRLEYTDIEELLLEIPHVADGPSMRKANYGLF
jgi:hypothetical protein